jgi:hypothetical protein
MLEIYGNLNNIFFFKIRIDDTSWYENTYNLFDEKNKVEKNKFGAQLNQNMDSAPKVVIDLSKDKCFVKKLNIIDKERVGIDLTTDIASLYVIKISKKRKNELSQIIDMKKSNHREDESDHDKDDEILRCRYFLVVSNVKFINY